MIQADERHTAAGAVPSTGKNRKITRRQMVAAAIVAPTIAAVLAAPTEGPAGPSVHDRKYEEMFLRAHAEWKAATARAVSDASGNVPAALIDAELAALDVLVNIPVSSAILFSMKYRAIDPDLMGRRMPGQSYSYGDVINWDIGRLVQKEWLA